MSDAPALKDYVDAAAVKRLGQQVQQAYPRFPLARFCRDGANGLSPLSFTERTGHIAAVLLDCLPKSRPRAIEIIEKAAPPALASTEGMFSENFWLWPMSDFLRDFGAAHWNETMRACYQLTQCFTAEFAVRPLLHNETDRTLAQLLRWTEDSSQHVRRLCSEGPRPRLPWAPRLDLSAKSVAPILSALRDDKVRYVQKSVANHLNDLGKTESDWLLKLMRQWRRGAGEPRQWIINHALRTHIKAGDAAALEIIGIKPVAVEQARLSLEPADLRIGGEVQATLQVRLKRTAGERILLDWVMHYHRPGRPALKKVFKGSAIKSDDQQSLSINKTFPLAVQSTRKVYSGPHRIEAQLNGKTIAAADFEVR